MSWGMASTCKSATDAWYAEVKDYDFSRPGNAKPGVNAMIGHFTQVRR